MQLTNLPYFIRRTASNQFPVYLVTKAGGTKQQTKIQKTEGDVDALRKDVALYLGLESGDPRAPTNPDVSLNRLNGHITVKVCFRSPEYRVISCGIGAQKKKTQVHRTNPYTGMEETRNPQVPFGT